MSSDDTALGPWLACRAPRPMATMRLFCIPFAGGGASVFNVWWRRLPPWVELHAIQLPGRESRLRERPVTDLQAAVHVLADAIVPWLDRSYALFGYSMGALLSFELARELRRRGAPMPAQLHLAARAAPHTLPTVPPLACLPRDAMVQSLRRYYEPPEQMWSAAEIVDLILPALRADIAMCEGYCYRPELPLACPIVALAGARDRSAPLPAVQAWREHTSAVFELDLIEGSHFFINTALDDVLAGLLRRFSRILPQR